MQNRYVGDAGDFGKYGLLRALSSEEMSLGVVWYLTRPTTKERRNNDGGQVGFLKDRNRDLFRGCDPFLYDALARIVRERRRNVRSIRKDGVLPGVRAFYENRLFYCQGWRRDRRKQFRNEWRRGALDETTGCNVVFLDPDNGFATPALRPFRLRGPKYVLFEEAAEFLKKEQSLIVYQHSGLSTTVAAQIQTMFCRIRSELRVGGRPFAMRYRRGTSRTYFILPSCERHRKVLLDRAVAFAQGPWGNYKHFDQPIESPV